MLTAAVALLKRCTERAGTSGVMIAAALQLPAETALALAATEAQVSIGIIVTTVSAALSDATLPPLCTAAACRRRLCQRSHPVQAAALLEVSALGQQLQQLDDLHSAHTSGGSALAPLQALCGDALSRHIQGAQLLLCNLRHVSFFTPGCGTCLLPH